MYYKIKNLTLASFLLIFSGPLLAQAAPRFIVNTEILAKAIQTAPGWRIFSAMTGVEAGSPSAENSYKLFADAMTNLREAEEDGGDLSSTIERTLLQASYNDFVAGMELDDLLARIGQHSARLREERERQQSTEKIVEGLYELFAGAGGLGRKVDIQQFLKDNGGIDVQQFLQDNGLSGLDPKTISKLVNGGWKIFKFR